MARERDYKAEYARRIASAAKRGLSRSQGRGHARHHEAPARPRVAKAVVADDRLELALKALRQTGNRAAAAKSVGVSPERLRRFLHENVQIEGRGRSLKITDDRHRYFTVLTRGKAPTLRLRDFDQASINGTHLDAVGKFLRTTDTDLLRPFEGRSVIDFRGKEHPLETDPNALLRIAAQGDEIFHEIYKLIPFGG